MNKWMNEFGTRPFGTVQRRLHHTGVTCEYVEKYNKSNHNGNLLQILNAMNIINRFQLIYCTNIK